MEHLAVVELARHLIRLVGPFRTVEFEDVTKQVRLTSAEQAAQRVMQDWVEARVLDLDRTHQLEGQRPIRRLPKPHVLGWQVNEDELLVTTVTRPFDYGHFAVTSKPEDAEALYRYYRQQMQRQSGQALSRQVFDLWCRHQQPASATLLVTSDEQMVLVRRSPGLFLHPSHIHVMGGQVEPGQADLFTSAAEEVVEESGVRHNDLEDWVCLGVCDNEPHQQPIFLCRCRTTLTGKQVLEGWARALDPDGPVFCQPFRRREVKRLLKHEQLTPSARALFYLTLNLSYPEGLAA